MAEFVRAQIFGTTFEITSRCRQPRCLTRLIAPRLTLGIDTQTSSPLVWELLVWSGQCLLILSTSLYAHQLHNHSSAKDQLTGQNVAVKKIMKPFSTPVLSKRTYRELKLLKHLRHENV